MHHLKRHRLVAFVLAIALTGCAISAADKAKVAHETRNIVLGCWESVPVQLMTDIIGGKKTWRDLAGRDGAFDYLAIKFAEERAAGDSQGARLYFRNMAGLLDEVLTPEFVECENAKLAVLFRESGYPPPAVASIWLAERAQLAERYARGLISHQAYEEEHDKLGDRMARLTADIDAEEDAARQRAGLALMGMSGYFRSLSDSYRPEITCSTHFRTTYCR